MRISKSSAAFAIVSALALTACGDNTSDPAPGSADPFADTEVLTFLCDETRVEARFLRDNARIVADSATYDLIRVHAETGVRYEAPNERALAFTAMGEAAVLSLPGDPDRNCRIIDA